MAQLLRECRRISESPLNSPKGVEWPKTPAYQPKPSACGMTPPNFDGQTLFTFVVGTVVTLITFWVGYKKTIGAQEERTRAANQDLIASVLRRVAVEREVMQAVQFEYIREAKSYKWPAPGSEDTEFGVLMEPEVRHGEAEVYAGVQA